MLVNGERLEGAGRPVPVIDPTSEETFDEVRSASSDQVEAAVAGAKASFKSWKRTPAAERGEMMHALSSWMTEHTDDLATTLTREGGKPLVENRDEMGWSAACLDFYAEIGRLELGGKDAFIVCDDVALDVAAKGAVWAAYLNSGQVCTSAERFYVHEKVFDEFVDRVVAETKRLVIGDPMDAATDIGPLVRGVQRDKVEAQLAAARSAGANILVGGDRSGFERGFFLNPAVVVDVDESMTIFSEETFGPVAPIAKVSSLDEAIERTNASPYGLGANIYTQRFDYMLKAMEEIEAGTVWFNDPLTDNEAAPFGGMKSSGMGRELGPEGLEDFRQYKHVHIDSKMDAKSWWYPYAAYAKYQAEHGTAPG